MAIWIVAPASTTVGILLNVAFYIYLNRRGNSNGVNLLSSAANRTWHDFPLLGGNAVQGFNSRRETTAVDTFKVCPGSTW